MVIKSSKQAATTENLKGARDLVAPERNTLQVSMLDVERLASLLPCEISSNNSFSLRYNTSLHTTILDEYYRVYPYLCAAVKNFVKDHVEAEVH